jgi:Flp pilus assembly protein TadG
MHSSSAGSDLDLSGFSAPDRRCHRPRPAPRAGGDGGAALVEFALVLPFLAILIFGAIDLGRTYELKNTLTNMAREGGSYAQYFPEAVDTNGTDACANGNNIEDRALAEEPDVGGVAITVRNMTTSTDLTGCNPDPGTGGEQIEVKATKSLTPFTPLLATILDSGTITVSGQIEVVVQG